MISGFQVSRDPRHQLRGDERSLRALSHRDLGYLARTCRVRTFDTSYLQFVALPLRLTSFTNHIHGAFPGLSRSLDELRSVQSNAPNSKVRPAKIRHATMATQAG